MVTWFGTIGMMWMWRCDWCNCSYLSPELLTIIHGAPSRYTWHGLQSSFYLAPSSYGYSLSLYLSLSLSLSSFFVLFPWVPCFYSGSMCINAYWLLMGDLSLCLSIYIYIYICLYISLSHCLCFFFF
ncbi:hypothetical protein AMTRI_Chr01g129470 [Amborella trichopoda]